ncbi:FemAB family XrtA/PEP-CTERM system-associated protein [Alkalilimnicola ehrlichii]|uniref:FemAB family XrtA/PEP-CTERM system-associated protein n=1 Tax=Alkalilimnicola ehrlichii TaxID=351052 RepID=UPI003BA34207
MAPDTLQGTTVQVCTLTPEAIPRWDAYVTACPEATFFHRAGWAEVIRRAFGHPTLFLFAEREGQIVGVLPLARVKSLLFGHSLISLPFCVYGGIVADDPGAARALDEAARAEAADQGVDHLEYRHRRPYHPDWPTKDLYVTFRKPIEPEVEANMNAIPRKQRRMVRKGIKAGLTSEVDTDETRFFPVYAGNVHRMGTPVFSRRYFRILKAVFGDDCEYLTVTRDGQPVASVLSFYFRDEVLPYYGGGTPLAREVAGYDFMYWELMRRGCEAGYRLFDFGRSKRGTGSFSFKKNWGFEPEPLHYEFELHRGDAVPDNNPLNPKYQRLIRWWQRLPLPVANAIGPYVVRNLG